MHTDERSVASDALRVVEEFCNSATLLHGTDALATIRGGQEWLVEHGWDGEPTLEQLASLRDSREVVRAFLADRTDPAARSALNRLALEHWAGPRIDDDGRLALTPSPAGALRRRERRSGRCCCTASPGGDCDSEPARPKHAGGCSPIIRGPERGRGAT
ncbi:ABATE domain-containing protein [Sphingomonas sp. LR61]|uniref:ABATE domain-containing protein n=1 Tax=Sphingomonas sp. LR61 TaxID=3050234 RepID=UPI002FE3B586